MSRLGTRMPFSVFFQPRGYLALLGAGLLVLSVLALEGSFEHTSRIPHQIGWGILLLGVFAWMSSDNSFNPEPWRGAFHCLIAYLFLASVFLYPILTSDGDFYYGITRSMLWNRDLNTMEEGARFSHSWMLERAAEGSAFGFPYHPFPIGVSLLWIPFVGVGHLQALVQRISDPVLTLNGYSEPYLVWLSIGTATLGAGFVFFGYLFLRLRYDHNLSSRAILGTLLATPGFFYCFRDSGFPHAASMAAIALYAWVWMRAPERMDWKQVFLLAIPLSLSALVRWQNSLFALAPVVYWFMLAWRQPPRSKSLVRVTSRILGLAGLCFLYCFPQLLFFRLRGPSWISLQHGGPEDFSWSNPKFFSLLCDERYGLITWHPYYILCGIGAILYLSKGSKKRALAWVGILGLWILLAFGNQSQGWLLPGTLGIGLLPMVSVGFVRREGWNSGPLGLAFACVFLEVFIDASYLLYHGGGDYGNRLVCDLILFASLGFVFLLSESSRHSWRWVVALLFTACFSWSLALLWKGTPKITRSPARLTELLSHSTPFASMIQGLGHGAIPLFLSGLWRISCLAFCCVLLFAVVRVLRGLWRNPRKQFQVILGFLALPILVSMWLFIDFRRVDANLYLDNRQSGALTHHAGVEVWRQTFNTELSPFIPPGKDSAQEDGRLRFHQNLSPESPTVSWLFPKKWPKGKPIPYIAENLTILSRVWSKRDLVANEPIARIEVAKFVPPATQSWTLRAGLHTSTPTQLDLPPSSPDWYHPGLGAIPRYFSARFPMSPTAELEVLKISLIPNDATLEIGAIWFSSSPNDPPLPWIENPNKNQMPSFDRQVFGKTEYRPLSFPTRFHSRVEEPVRYFSQPDPNKDRPDPEFLFFEDPWIGGGKVPFQLQMGNLNGRKWTGWHVLESSHPAFEWAIEPLPIDQVAVAMALGPAPSRWDQGPVAHLKILDGEKVVSETDIEPGRNISFWREPYLPATNLIWKETRGFFAPVGIFAVSTDCPPDSFETRKISIELTPEAKNSGVDLAIMGITARIDKDSP